MRLPNNLFYYREKNNVCQAKKRKVFIHLNSYRCYRTIRLPEIYSFLEESLYRLLSNFKAVGQGFRPYLLPCLQGYFSQFREAFRGYLRYQEFPGIKAFADCQRATETVGFYTREKGGSAVFSWCANFKSPGGFHVEALPSFFKGLICQAPPLKWPPLVLFFPVFLTGENYGSPWGVFGGMEFPLLFLPVYEVFL